MNPWLFGLDVIGMSLVGILFMVLGIVVFLQNPRSHVHHAFAGIMTGVYVITLLEILRLATLDPGLLTVSYRLTFAVGMMVIATVLYFTQVFPDDPELPMFWRYVIFLVPVPLALIAAFTDRMIIGLALAPSYLGGPIALKLGPWFWGVRIYITLMALYANYTLAYKWMRAQGVQKIKLAYVLLAFLVGGLIVVFLLLLLPFFDIEFYRITPLAASLGVLIALRGIMRYRLFRVLPYLAAEQILETLGDTVLVLDLDGRIVYGQVPGRGELEPLLRPVVEMVIAGKKVANYNINFSGRYFALSAGFISEGGGAFIILNDISDMERSLTEQDLIREKLVKRLEKETIIRRTLSALAQVKEAEEIRSIIPPVEISSDPELMQAIDRLEKATRNRLELLAKTQTDRRELLKKVEEAERVYNAGVQRELEVVELREKIRKLKEAKGIL